VLVELSPADRPRTKRTARPIWDRKKKGIATIVAMTAWMIRLPEPASMYARTGCISGMLLGGFCVDGFGIAPPTGGPATAQNDSIPITFR
jgi:hypothetical protein